MDQVEVQDIIKEGHLAVNGNDLAPPRPGIFKYCEEN